MFYYDSTYLLVIFGIFLTIVVQIYMTNTFNKYQNVRSNINISAAEVAKRIMNANGIYDVVIGRVPGNMTDHYSPLKKELNLSDSTINSNSIASIGVAAHEVGHAIQDNERFSFLVLQMAITPTLSFISKCSIPVLFIGFIFGSLNLIRLGMYAFIATLIYQLLTLPIEFDASRRAINTLRDLQILDENELYGAKRVLNAAAMTYVAAAAVTALQLLRFSLLFGRRRD